MCKHKFFLIFCILTLFLSEGNAIANESSPWDRVDFPSDSQGSGEDSRSAPRQNILRDVGKLTGNDRPDLREDARDFRNVTGITASAVEEFLGVDTSKYVGYLDLFLGLFRRKKQDDVQGDSSGQDGIIAGQEGQDDLLSGGTDTLEAADVVGAAGVINPGLAREAAKNADFSGGGGGPLGFNPQILQTRLTASELLNLQQEQLAVQLGDEGQALIAAKEQEGLKAMEAVNTVANEIQDVSATQDAIKLGAKQRSLLAVLAQVQASEQQQTRLAQLQNNQSQFRSQEIMESQEFRRDLQQVIKNNAAFRSASLFSGTYGSQGGLR